MRFMSCFTGLMLISAALTSAANAAQPAGGIAWQHDIEAAKAEAARTGKLVLIHFWTPSCGPCRKLDKSVFNQPAVAQQIHAKYVPVKLNAMEYRATAEGFGISRVPTDVIITSQGQPVRKIISPGTAKEYVGTMTKISDMVAAVRRNANERVAQRPTSQPVNPAYASLVVQSPPTQSNPAVPQNQTTQQAPIVAPVKPAATQPATQPNLAIVHNTAPSENDRYAATTRYQVAPAPAAASPVVEQQRQAPVDTALNAKTPAVIESKTTETKTEPTTDVQVAATQNKPQVGVAPIVAKSATQAAQPSIGLEGFCPVSLKQSQKWVKGDTKWGIVHRGKTYLFASEAMRDEFWKKPDAYSPALSGYDPVIALDQQQSVDGQRIHGVEYGGQIYLFSSEQSLKTFWQNPDRYVAGVMQAVNAASQRVIR